MIDYFNIPPPALINTPISKKLFAEKASLSITEKRMLREDIVGITMKGLLQTRTIGIAAYIDDEYIYDQIIFAEIKVRNSDRTSAIATMIQKAFPAPMFIILHEQDDSYCVNWCVKRVNQADKSKRVIQEQQTTRFFSLNNDDKVVKGWLHSLDITKINCTSLKELFDEISNRLLMLAVSDEAGMVIEADIHKIEQFRSLLEQLAVNREDQKKVGSQIKEETQFNVRLKLTSKLKELQNKEHNLKEQLKEKEDVL